MGHRIRSGRVCRVLSVRWEGDHTSCHPARPRSGLLSFNRGTIISGSYPDSDPPQTFEVAEQRFARFLGEQGYPATVCWVTPGSVLVGTNRCYYVRVYRPEAFALARERYSRGLECGLGIALIAFCNSDRETFAIVIIPKDDLDRQNRLMGKLLKLSCPLPSARAIVVKDPRRWEILQMRHEERSKLIEL